MQLVWQGHRQCAHGCACSVSAVVQKQQYGAWHHSLPPKRAKTGTDSVGFVFYRNGDDNRFLVELRPLLAREHQSGSDIARLGRTMGRIDRIMRQMPPGAGWGDDITREGTRSRSRNAPVGLLSLPLCSVRRFLNELAVWSRSASERGHDRFD